VERNVRRRAQRGIDDVHLKPSRAATDQAEIADRRITLNAFEGERVSARTKNGM
jgi:hypothetical protein